MLQQIITGLTAVVMALQASLGGAPASNQLAQVVGTANLFLSPASNSAALNSTFNVNVVLNTSGQAAYGADINRLRFNPSILQVVDADSGTSGVQIQPGNLMAFTVVNSVDNSGGSIQFSQLANPGSTFSGSGTLATITFRVVAVGTSNVTFDFNSGSGTDTNIAGLGGDLLSSVSSGIYTGTNPVDTTAPAAPGTPALTVVSSAAINLGWIVSTDNVAVTGYRVERCSGSTSCSNFSQVGTPAGNSYSDTGLTGSTIYRYRVRSIDAAGNLSPYSVAAHATTQAVVVVPVQRRIILDLEGAPSNKKNISGVLKFLNTSTGAEIGQMNFTTDTSGQNTVTVPSGLPASVHVRAVVSGYLSKIVNTIDLTNATVLNVTLPRLQAGDFNNDGLINSLDFSYMNGKWGGADSLSDVNRDGAVNSLDFAYLSNNWLDTGE